MVSPETAAGRLGAAGADDRPLLDGTGPLAARIASLLAERRALYEEAADAAVPTDGRTPEAVAEEIRRAWEARWGPSGS
jgi:shikimate kinase